ncbi:MAG TPA: hypothetical protein VHX14_20720 [Thermoanaerobaculia bacterium]|nr:hypothetical protein [Thermoanaerobaculia bacterium]
MRRALVALLSTVLAMSACGSSLTVDTGVYGNGAPNISWWGAAVYQNDQGETGVGVGMSGNLSLFDQYGSTVSNDTWSTMGGQWSGSNSGYLEWATCYSSAVNARTFDQFAQKYGNSACNPVGPGPGNNDDDGVLAKCGADGNGCAEPLLINLDNGPYRLTGLDDPVSFDIHANGQHETMGWTARYASLAFLAMDRNGNGSIDDGSELFGNASRLNNGQRAANGFEALAQYDSNGDGAIDEADPAWSSLLLWTDRNHNGVSDPGELETVASSGLTRIYLAHHWTGRRDASGNSFGYQGQIELEHGRRVCYDVFFALRR